MKKKLKKVLVGTAIIAAGVGYVYISTSSSYQNRAHGIENVAQANVGAATDEVAKTYRICVEYVDALDSFCERNGNTNASCIEHRNREIYKRCKRILSGDLRP